MPAKLLHSYIKSKINRRRQTFVKSCYDIFHDAQIKKLVFVTCLKSKDSRLKLENLHYGLE